MIRRLIPATLVPLCVVAGVLAALPWLHSFPVASIGVPVFGAAVLAVLVPVAARALGAGRLRVSILVDVVSWLVFVLLVVLRDPLGFAALWHGLYDGPAQILTFALPLVGPRSLFVAPVTLVWLAGALAGETLTRRWQTIVPYPAFLGVYGLAYAATVRGAASSVSSVGVTRAGEVAVAGGLLASLLLLRLAQSWVHDDETAEATQDDSVLPLRGLVGGAVTALVITALAATVVQSGAFPGHRATPQRVPSVRQERPLSPVGFVSTLRPNDPSAPGTPVFTVQTDAASSGYFDIANTDRYDGAGWSFQRTFRPSGGVLPDDPDAELAGARRTVTQTYLIDPGPLAGQPWLPYLTRPRQVSGAAVNIDADSGMIVPATPLRAGERYRVSSRVATTAFAALEASASVATGTTGNGSLPPAIAGPVRLLAEAFSRETGAPTTPAIGFLQAVDKDLKAHYALTEGTATDAGPSATPSAAGPSPAAASPGARAGTAGFADVLASVVGPARAGTPEQYATLVALLARDVGVPARVVSGFRVRPPRDGALLPSGTYPVTTAEAWTWVEIPVVGEGWVILDAAPDSYTSVQPTASVTAKASQSPSASPSRNALITPGNGGHAIAPHSSVPGPRSALISVVISLLIAFGALLVLALAVVAVRKPLRRRRRRRRPDPRARSLGAWLESMDALSEAGLGDLATRTGSEVVSVVADRLGPSPAADAERVATLVRPAAYRLSRPVTEQDAEQAWAAERELRRTLARQRSWRQRVASWLRYHRAHPNRPAPGPASWVEEVRRRDEPATRRRTRHVGSHRRRH